MAELLKFTFNTGFGTRSEVQSVDDEVPVITQADVDAARTQGFVQGREDGLAEATAQFNNELTASVTKFSTDIQTLLNAQSLAAKTVKEEAHHYSLLIAQKIAKSALNHYPFDQIETLVNECLSFINEMPHLVIRVNPEIVQSIQDQIQPIIDEKGFEGRLIIMGEEDIARGDCAIEWADGGVTYNTQEIVQTISNKLAEYFDFDAEAVAAEAEVPELETEPATPQLAEAELIEEDIYNEEPQEFDVEENSMTDFEDDLEMIVEPEEGFLDVVAKPSPESMPETNLEHDLTGEQNAHLDDAEISGDAIETASITGQEGQSDE